MVGELNLGHNIEFRLYQVCKFSIDFQPCTPATCMYVHFFFSLLFSSAKNKDLEFQHKDQI